VCQVLWQNQTASYDSSELSFANIHQMPKPSRPGGVPIWVSGTVNRRSMDRLARYGSGWIPWGDDAADIEAGIARMRAAVADRDRDPGDLGVVGTLPAVKGDDGALDLEQTMEPVSKLHQAGVTDFRIGLKPPRGEQAAVDYLTPVVTAFRSRAEGWA
jgi:alkanesulfonate monooxygenase SsuD/methylene tetrahydromethanopterin reductase-like flavin-dependent oxidoreductase (luciferase family)